VVRFQAGETCDVIIVTLRRSTREAAGQEGFQFSRHARMRWGDRPGRAQLLRHVMPHDGRGQGLAQGAVGSERQSSGWPWRLGWREVSPPRLGACLSSVDSLMSSRVRVVPSAKRHRFRRVGEAAGLVDQLGDV
jgi:hypothetical protein